jgi:poly-gamma-glutamate synthesis protein (capsule biosynthesis protein)
MDYGADGLLDTIAALDRAGIAHAGAGPSPEAAHAPAIVTVKGIRIAVLAYVNVPDDSVSGFVARSMAAAPGKPGVAWGTADAVRRDVQAAKQEADVVIVSMHSGYEYTAAANDIQQELAHAAIDAGAALVLGGHPHVLQGVEFYHDAPIIYSLGNFIFDLDDDDRRQPGLPSVLSVIFRVTLTAKGVRAVRFLPAVIDPKDARPKPVEGADARPVLERLYRLTDALGAGG